MQVVKVKVDKVTGSEHEGYFLDSSSYDRVIDFDCEVYDEETGQKIVDFRKGALSGIEDKHFDVFKKVAKTSRNGNRGLASGREYEWTMGSRHRLPTGVKNVIEKGKNKKGWNSFSEIEKALAEGTDPSNFFWLARNYEDRDWEGFLEIVKAADPTEWQQLFKDYRQRFVDPQARANLCYSNVFGAFGRTGRNPYCSLSKATLNLEEEYSDFQPLYDQVGRISEEAFPDKYELMKTGLSETDPLFTLFGTGFTSITVNWNFRLASHFDGRNFPGGFATLTVFERGDFEGHLLVFPELRLAFNLRQGDTISADTCLLLHGNTAKTGDGERVSLVFFTRKDVSEKCHSAELDKARKAFCSWSRQNLADTRGNGRKGWGGGYVGMFDSPEWYGFWEDWQEKHGVEVELKEKDKKNC